MSLCVSEITQFQGFTLFLEGLYFHLSLFADDGMFPQMTMVV